MATKRQAVQYCLSVQTHYYKTFPKMNDTTAANVFDLCVLREQEIISKNFRRANERWNYRSLLKFYFKNKNRLEKAVKKIVGENRERKMYIYKFFMKIH